MPGPLALRRRPSPTPTGRCSTGARSTPRAPAEGRRGRGSRFDGLFYQGDVWLDGAYLGDTEGYFVPHTFEVTDALRARGEHHLAVEVTCAPQGDLTAKRNLTGVFQHWDCLDPDWNPGGIWRPVRIDETGPVRIRGLRVLCREATAERAVVVLRATLDSAGAARRARCAPTHRRRRPRGSTSRWPTAPNEVEWTVTIDQPGAVVAAGARRPDRCTTSSVEVGARRARAPRPSDERRLPHRPAPGRSCATGSRSVNGERLFLKGSNQGPTRMALAEATPAELARDVDLALGRRPRPAAHPRPRHPARAVRRGRRARPAALAGPARCSGATPAASASRPCARPTPRSSCSATTRRSRSGAGTTSRWPSRTTPTMWGDPKALRRMAVKAARRAAAADLEQDRARPLDQARPRAGRRHPAGHRPLRRAPPPAAARRHRHPPLLRLVPRRRARPAPASSRAVPRMARFVTEFGAQAVPDDRRLLRARALARPRLGAARAHPRAAEGRSSTATCRRPTTPPSSRGATPPRRTRRMVVRRHIEALRRLKYRPTGGFAQFCFADGAPRRHLVGARPRPGPEARLRRAAGRVPAGDRRRRPAAGRRAARASALALDVHVVSDLRAPIDGRRGRRPAAAWPGGERDVALGRRRPGRRLRAGRHACSSRVPDVAGPLTLELTLPRTATDARRQPLRRRSIARLTASDRVSEAVSSEE